MVFGCIATNVNGYSCPYVNPGACGYGTAVGIVAFMGLVAFVVLDALFESIINLDNRRYVVISEISFLGLFGLVLYPCGALTSLKVISQIANFELKISSFSMYLRECIMFS